MNRTLRIFAVLAAIAAGTVASAQGYYGRWEDWDGGSSRVNSRARAPRFERDIDPMFSMPAGNELRIGYGCSAPSRYMNMFTSGSYSYVSSRNLPSSGTMDYIYSDYYLSPEATGIFNVGFSHVFSRWFSLSLDCGFDILSAGVMNGTSGRYMTTRKGTVVTLLSTARFYYLSRPWVRLYGYAGLGFCKTFGFDRYCLHPAYDSKSDYYDRHLYGAFQIAPIGIEVGRRLFFSLELGSGDMYEGMLAGIGYRF